MIAKPNEKISATWRSNIFGIGPVVMRKAKRSRYEFCHECRCRFDFDKDVGAKKDARQAPMLFDGTWRHLGGKWEILCADCMWKRGRGRGVEITLADLRPCEFNQEWFNEFAHERGAPDEVIGVWLKWARHNLNEELERRRRLFDD